MPPATAAAAVLLLMMIMTLCAVDANVPVNYRHYLSVIFSPLYTACAHHQ